MGQYIKPINTDYLRLSGGTVTGDTYFSQNLSASTIISGSTNLYDIFQIIGSDLNKTYIQSGLNTYTAGTEDNPSVNISAATLDTLFVSGNTTLQIISAMTIISGTTNLYDIFLTTADGNDITRVQPGGNITTGGTVNNPVINLIASPIVNNLTASGNTNLQTVSATTIYSASTSLYSIFISEYDTIDAGIF